MRDISCKQCGTTFTPSAPHVRLCSAQCVLNHNSAWRSNGCREWTGLLTPKGYGELRYNKVGWRAHRLQWILAHGPIPNGLVVMHKCDNPACIALDHLKLGTCADNTADMIAKRRNMKGGQCSWAKLTDSQVADIKERLRTGKRGIVTALANEYGVHHVTISDIKRGKKWGELNIAAQPTR